MTGIATFRSALLLFCVDSTNREKIKVLIGESYTGITSIGGRSWYQENEFACLMRECEEETKELLNYSNQSDFFSIHPIHKIEKYKGCLYVFIQSTEENLEEKVKEFSSAKTNKNNSDELKNLLLVDINDLICDMIKNEKKYNTNFLDMFLSVGYDIIKGNEWNKLKTRLGIEFEISSPLDSIPNYVSLLPFNKDHKDRDLLPKVYGYNAQRKLYLSDQFYTRIGDKYVFRSGIFTPKNS